MIELDPSSPWGYERKHVALHKAGDYDNAIGAFQQMLLKMEQSPDPDIHREFARGYGEDDNLLTPSDRTS